MKIHRKKNLAILLAIFSVLNTIHSQTTPNCKTSAFPGQCSACNDGFYLSNNIGTSCLACSSTNCITCGNYSATVPGSPCLKCKTNFYSDPATGNCLACPTGCKSCDPSEPTRCLDCQITQW